MFSEFLGRRDQSSESGEIKTGLESRLSLQRAIGAVVKWDRYREANKYVYQEKLKNFNYERSIISYNLYGAQQKILSNARHKMLLNIRQQFDTGWSYIDNINTKTYVILPNNLF